MLKFFTLEKMLFKMIPLELIILSRLLQREKVFEDWHYMILYLKEENECKKQNSRKKIIHYPVKII